MTKAEILAANKKHKKEVEAYRNFVAGLLVGVAVSTPPKRRSEDWLEEWFGI